MALIQCPECGKEISDKAKSCPNCGVPIENDDTVKVDEVVERQVKKKIPKLVPLFVILVIIAVATLVTIYISTASSNKIEDVEKSVVKIYCYDSEGNPTATGSGFIVYDSNTLVTNYHVLKAASSMVIETEEKANYTVSNIISYSEETDIAILKIDGQTNLNPLDINNALPQKGDKVYAIGSPVGLKNTVSEGIVSGIRDYTDKYNLIQISAPINHGSSGGALFDDKFNVIGVTSSGLETTGDLNYAIPVQVVEDLYESRQKEYDTVSDLYKGNLIKSDIKHTCQLEKMKSTNTYSIGALSADAKKIAGEEVFVYGYYSSKDSDNMYLYSNINYVTGDSEFDREYSYEYGEKVSSSTNVIIIPLKYAYYHSSKEMEVGDLVLVGGYVSYSDGTGSFLAQYLGECYGYHPSEIINVEGTGIL